jgi:hypothetical protein
MVDKKATICVVGSGPGGGIAAIELAESGLFKVILVDLDKISAIPQDFPEVSKLISTINIGYSFVQHVTRGFGFGGGSGLWHGVLTKLDDEDFCLLDSRVKIALSDEVKLYYKKTEKYFGKIPYKLAEKLKKILSKQDLFSMIEKSGKFIRKDFFVQKNPLRLRRRLQSAKELGLPIEFVENAIALRVNSEFGEADTIKSLLIDVQGEKRLIFADYFILSAGALETPRIILQSLFYKSINIININIGKYLQDHPWTILGTIISKKNNNFRVGLTDIFSPGNNKYRLGYRLLIDGYSEKIGCNHCVAIKPFFIGEYSEFKEALKTIIFQKNSLKNIFVTIKRFGVLNVLGSIFMLLNEKFGLGAHTKRALVFCYLEQPERIDSCVTLSSNLDSRGRIIPKINWIVDKEEFLAVNKITNHFNAIINNSKFFSFIPNNTSIQDISSGSHHAGTMRIGSCQASGAIDSNLMVFGTNNLFVCDLSIFPNYGNSNPTFTLAAFSIRLADFIIAKEINRRSPNIT